jgi:hypothetical protein
MAMIKVMGADSERRLDGNLNAVHEVAGGSSVSGRKFKIQKQGNRKNSNKTKSMAKQSPTQSVTDANARFVLMGAGNFIVSKKARTMQDTPRGEVRVARADGMTAGSEEVENEEEGSRGNRVARRGVIVSSSGTPSGLREDVAQLFHTSDEPGRAVTGASVCFCFEASETNEHVPHRDRPRSKPEVQRRETKHQQKPHSN